MYSHAFLNKLTVWGDIEKSHLFVVYTKLLCCFDTIHPIHLNVEKNKIVFRSIVEQSLTRSKCINSKFYILLRKKFGYYLCYTVYLFFFVINCCGFYHTTASFVVFVIYDSTFFPKMQEGAFRLTDHRVYQKSIYHYCKIYNELCAKLYKNPMMYLHFILKSAIIIKRTIIKVAHQFLLHQYKLYFI